ncbi:MAG TPA: GDSL-type esterase/lipase family protein [Kofleriaceae bacterium]|jgi:lysophospholipase L1-like esterase
MPPSDRSWTVMPTLAWFAGFVVVGLVAIDHDVAALADRLVQPREPQTAKAGPIAPPVTAIAENDSDEPAQAAPLPPPPPGSHDVGALTDACVDGRDLRAAGSAAAVDPKCASWAMDGFYRAVDRAKHGALSRPVRVSWYGDSVVASDLIPGHLRARLQAELGDGGPGFVYVVPPHRFNEHEAITRSQTGTWYTHTISTLQTPDGLYGPGGSTTESSGAHSVITLVAGKVEHAELYYLTQPKGGTASVTADGSDVLAVDTAGDARAPGWAGAAIAGGASKLDIATKGRTRLFGIDLENARGAVVDNLGVVSVNVKSFANNDPEHWKAELAHRGADLVMIMIGANEAEWLGPHDQDTKAYQAHYEQVLAIVRAARPDATCLVVSPTDQAEAKDGAYPSRPVMPVLVAAQAAAAKSQGCAFYSTYAWMGGKGSASKWFAKGWVSSDFQHLSKKGADKLADAVFDALMAGYQGYAARTK